MCGIFGLIHKNKQPVAQETLDGALRLLAHRGPDGQGTFRDGPLGMAHSRLAIFDPSTDGRQPMAFRHYTIVFNGAIYNFPELREELHPHGYTFRTQTDTELILAAYDHWGEDCVHHFNGMWAFAIYDQKQQLLFCSRGRFGIRPFYYLDDGNCFAFASETKAFGAIPGYRFRLNKLRTYEFLTRGWQCHTDECMVEGIRQLPAGCSATYDIATGQWEIRRYYHLEDQVQKPEGRTFLARRERFSQLLQDSVHLRLRADVPVALSLSGGMDSSSVLALQQQEQPGQPLDCFSVAFPGTPYDETPWIGAAARHFRPPLQKLQPTFEDIMAGLDQTCWHQDEPIASAAVIAHFLLMGFIRRHGFKVMLNGQGADEILGGYDKFYWPFFKELARSRPWQLPAEAAGLLRRSPPTLSDAWRRYRQYRSTPATPDWLQPAFARNPEQLSRRSPDTDVAACSRNLIREVGLPVLLHYEDRNAMAHGVESRLPFLDHRLVEYSLSLPAEDKIHFGIRKYMLRRAMEGRLPKAILQRYAKLGFPTPQMEWMEEHAGLFLDQVKDTVRAQPGIFSKQLISRTETALKSRERHFYPVIWRVVTFGRWLEIGRGRFSVAL